MIPEFMGFDKTWGISPACWSGDHDFVSNYDGCRGEWHLDWSHENPFLDSSAVANNRWVACRCGCHEYITDEEWKALRQKYQELVAKSR